MTIHQRFKEIRKSLNMTQTEFGAKIGKSLRAIQNYESGIRNINNDALLPLKNMFNVNIDWLITGNGNMFIDNKQNQNIAKVQIKNITNSNVDNSINIPYYTDISASAGYGAFTGMEEYENVIVSKSIIKVNDYSAIITVTGDSMEPTLLNKDKIIIDTNDKYELKKNKIYVINKEGFLYIKRYNACINGMHIFTSDNTKYESLIINEYDTSTIIGRLKSVIRDFN